MKITPFLLLINTVIACTSYAMCDSTPSTNRHTVQFYVGKMAYANSMNLPNGLPGKAFAFEYKSSRDKANNAWSSHFSSSIVTAGLRYSTNQNQGATIYRFNDMAIEVGWHWRAPKLFQNTTISAGFGPTLVAELTYPTQKGFEISHILSPYGHWGLNCMGHLHTLLSTKRFDLGWDLGIAIFGFGHVPKPPYVTLNLSQNPYTYYLQPNAAYHLLSYRMMSSRFNISAPHNNLIYTISYIFKYFNHSLAPFHQKYVQHSVGLGLTF